MERLSRNIAIAFLIIFVIVIAACSPKPSSNKAAIVVSVSSDGHYAISTHLDHRAVLWNLRKHKKQLVSKDANPYSAYFIKNSDMYLWQDMRGFVHVETVNGKSVMVFPGVMAYGNVMTTNLKHYFAVDGDWNLYAGMGQNQHAIKKGFNARIFLEARKLLNLQFSEDQQRLLTSGFINSGQQDLPLSLGPDAKSAGLLKKNEKNYSLLDGVVIWDVASGDPIAKLTGDQSQVFAEFGPSDNVVVGGDAASMGFIWSVRTGQRVLTLDSLIDSPLITPKGQNNGEHPIPKQFRNRGGFVSTAILSIKFVDTSGDYLRFTHGVPYAILYNINNPAPLKYFSLGTNPWPAVERYYQDESIDSAPKANILVTGQEFFGGINVYRYNPDKQTLTKEWSPKRN